MRENLEERLKRSLVPPSWYIRYLYRKNIRRDERELAIVPLLADRQRAAIDVGANKGVYSYAMLSCSSQVIAFEPNPKSRRVLESWARGKVTIYPGAAGDEDGTATLRIPRSVKGYSNQLATLSDVPVEGKECLEEVVPVHKLDTLDLPPVGFIKIDVEGHESAVLAGAAQLIQRDRPALLIEIEEKHTGRPLAEMLNDVIRLGYVALNLTHTGALAVVEPSKLAESGLSNNFIFLPKHG